MSAGRTEGDADVRVDLPAVKIEKLHLDVADTALKAQVLKLVDLSLDVGGDSGKLCLDLENVEAQAHVQIRLDRIGEVVDHVLTEFDRHPELAKGLSRAVTQGDSGNSSNGNGSGEPSAGHLAKVVAKTAAKEIGSAASDEAKEIGLTAVRKAREIGERRRERRAERHNATQAALELAEEAGVDVDDLNGSGAAGRVTVRDVRQAAT